MKILSIGNSFSIDAQEYLYQILEDMGYEDIVLGNLYISGCTLSTHLANAESNSRDYKYYTNTNGKWMETEDCRMLNVVESEDWDYITFQQASGYSGLQDTYDDLPKLIDIVKPLCTEAKLAWHMTWAYQGDSSHKHFVNYNNSQETMYQAIVSAVQQKIVTNSNIDIIIPTGTAVQNARTSYLGDTLTRDGYHMTKDFGRYLAGLTFARALTGASIDSVEFLPDGVTEQKRNIAVESVNNSIVNPYQVTNSQYTTEN